MRRWQSHSIWLPMHHLRHCVLAASQPAKVVHAVDTVKTQNPRLQTQSLQIASAPVNLWFHRKLWASKTLTSPLTSALSLFLISGAILLPLRWPGHALYTIHLPEYWGEHNSVLNLRQQNWKSYNFRYLAKIGCLYSVTVSSIPKSLGNFK